MAVHRGVDQPLWPGMDMQCCGIYSQESGVSVSCSHVYLLGIGRVLLCINGYPVEPDIPELCGGAYSV